MYSHDRDGQHQWKDKNQKAKVIKENVQSKLHTSNLFYGMLMTDRIFGLNFISIILVVWKTNTYNVIVRNVCQCSVNTNFLLLGNGQKAMHCILVCRG